MRVLIFGTTYEDNQDRAELHDMWVKLHGHLNPGCDLLLVDSASPWRPALIERHSNIRFHVFPDNVGHLFRGGQDGSSRAFCFGLHYAEINDYDYVAFIEGDSLCRLDVMDITQWMRQEQAKATGVIYHQTNKITKATSGPYVESGLLFLSVDYIHSTNLVARYNWRNMPNLHRPDGVPLGAELHLLNLIGRDLKVMPWKARRGSTPDFSVVTITPDNAINHDWITHCFDFRCYERFFEAYS